MAVARKTRPTLVQSNLATFLLACLSLATCPVTLAMTVVCYAITALTGTSLGYAFRQRAANQPARTVLITGGRANKALTLCRAFKREGYRVVLAEEARWGFLTCAAFSRAVDHYHLLPDPLAAPDAYIAALTHLAAMHGADAWVPCSSVQATMVDADAALQLAAAGSAPFIPCPAVAGALHWKDQFEALCVALGYPVPESRRVTSVGDAVAFLHAPDTLAAGHRFLLKSLTLDDLGRDDLTLFPLATRGATARHLAGVPTPLSEADPFLLQRFLVGREYCTHVAARDGKVVAFVACKSNQLLMRYADVRNLSEEERAVGYRLEAWTQEFLDRYKAKLAGEDKRGWEHALTGHFSFDFIIDDDTIYVLECNVVSISPFRPYGTRTHHASSAHTPQWHSSPSTPPLRRTTWATPPPAPSRGPRGRSPRAPGSHTRCR